jgi:Fe-S oxidoreductase
MAESQPQVIETPQPTPLEPREIDTAKIKDALKNRLPARLKMNLKICAHCALCADTCHYYLAHDKDPHMIPANKVKPLLKLIQKKGEVDFEFMKKMYDIAYGECTMCRRCAIYCPFGIDIASMVGFMRGLCVAQGMVPEGLANAIKNYQESGNQMAITDEEWVDTIQWMEEDLQEELPGATIPIDKHGAKVMYTVNAREPKFYPMDIYYAAKIFYLAGEDWTVPSKPGWDDTNLAMFAGDMATAKYIVSLTRDRAVELGVKQVAMTECGHAFRANKFEGPMWLGEKLPYEVVHSVELFAKYLREGRLKIKEKGFLEPATYQDPCNVSRNGGLAQEGRYLMNRMCADFRDMMPDGDGNYNFCCGGGGGAMPMGGPFRPHRIAAGKVKADQIKATGAKVVIVPCHNCFDQINDLNKKYDLGVKVIQFKEVFEELLIVPDELKAPDEDEEGGEE